MIELYAWGTTNGRRPLIILEEAQIPYKLIPTDIHTGANKTPDYLKISPFGKIPSMVDTEGPGGARVSLFESTAILLYLAEKSGKFMGSKPAEKPDVIKWLQFASATVLPLFQLMRTYKEVEAAGAKPLDVLDQQLASSEFLAGSYSIADMALITRLASIAKEHWVTDRASLKRWVVSCTARPATKKALEMKVG